MSTFFIGVCLGFGIACLVGAYVLDDMTYHEYHRGVRDGNADTDRIRDQRDAWKQTAVDYMTSRVEDEGGLDPDWGIAKIYLARKYSQHLKEVRDGNSDLR